MKDLSYVVGRLHGLNELVSILKSLVYKNGCQDETVTIITDHIAQQLDSILKDFDKLDVPEEHKEKLQEIKEKHAELAPIEAKPKEKEAAKETAPEEQKAEPKGELEKHEKTVDDLLKDLESIKN
jgi:actin-related protein